MGTVQPIDQPKREPLSKKLRFEVFKRDKFTCQYCGAKAPEAILHADHMKPVVDGGVTEITNLLTACQECNLGKGRRRLSDTTIAEKSHLQLAELQERREQLEMMMEWQHGLAQLDDDTHSHICAFWEELAPTPSDWSISPSGEGKIKRWIARFGVEAVATGMRAAAKSYLVFDVNGYVTRDSWDRAFSKITGCIIIGQVALDNPDIQQLYYIRGVLRNRIRYCDDGYAIGLMKAAHKAGVSIHDIRNLCYEVRSWTEFKAEIQRLAAEASGGE